jgi:hypothetical protein
MKHATYLACEEVNYKKPDKLVEVRNVYALNTNTKRYGYINRLETMNRAAYKTCTSY